MMKRILLSAAAVVAVALVLIFIPASPAVMVVDMTVLGYVGSLPVTGYAVCMAIGVAAAFVLTTLLAERRGLPERRGIGAVNGIVLSLVSGVSALVCSRALYCIVRWSYIINDLCGSPAFIWELWQGGYTMYGAIFGALLGVVLYARAGKLRIAPLMDVAVPAIAVALLLGRVGDAFIDQGVGSYVANEALSMLPFVTLNEWDEAQLLVRVYEAIMAGVAAVAALLVLRKGPAGRAAETGLTLISIGQIIFDSWRGDELIKFGFVRLNMIMAAVTLAFIITTRIVRCVRSGSGKGWSIARAVIFVAGAGVVIAIEFALDKSTINNTLLYGVMAATLAAMTACVLIGDGREA